MDVMMGDLVLTQAGWKQMARLTWSTNWPLMPTV